MGTNASLKRVVAGQDRVSYRDLLYTRRRFITKGHLRYAIGEVVNKTLQARLPHIWGEGTTACASDARYFEAWDQNLMTEWRARYGGPVVGIYWHVERHATCIYSQLKTCSSSEVASMIQGVLRHCTEMEVDRHYVDSHGHTVKWTLGPVDPMTIPTAAGPVEADQVGADPPAVRRDGQAGHRLMAKARPKPSRSCGASPATTCSIPPTRHCRSLARLAGRFFCRYLRSAALRREINEGLNVVENWNSANDFILFGKS